LGSEKAVRDNTNQIMRPEEKKAPEQSPFVKRSFQEFQQEKFHEFLLDKGSVLNFIGELDSRLEDKKLTKLREVDLQQQKGLMSPRTASRKEQAIEKWAVKEKRDLDRKKRKVLDTQDDIAEFMERLDDEKANMQERLGKRARRTSFGTSHSDILSASDDSLTVREAKAQIRDLASSSIGQSTKMKDIDRKKKTAQKLIDEKERAVRKGLERKLRDLEGDQADKILKQALNLDVEREVDRRIRAAKRRGEEEEEDSYGSEDDESQYTESLEESKALSRRSVLSRHSKKSGHGKRSEKQVKFATASPERFSSVNSQKDVGSSGKHSVGIEDSIGESI
jgi:hypothetical protein